MATSCRPTWWSPSNRSATIVVDRLRVQPHDVGERLVGLELLTQLGPEESDVPMARFATVARALAELEAPWKLGVDAGP